MPPINLFIFPIIGGYYILIRSELVRYRQQRLESQKIIFNSFLAGIFLLVISWIITKTITYCLPGLVTNIQSFYPVQFPFFGTCVGALVISVLATEVSNLFISKQKQIGRAIDLIGNDFERLCKECYYSVGMIQLTLANKKCYVGLITALPIPSPHSSYISILPVFSGYRTDTMELKLTTQYLDVYAQYVAEGEVQDVRTVTSTKIKVDQIISANKFDIEMYDRFKKSGEESDHTPNVK